MQKGKENIGLKTPEKRQKLLEYNEKRTTRIQKRHEEQTANRQKHVYERIQLRQSEFIAQHGLNTFDEVFSSVM